MRKFISLAPAIALSAMLVLTPVASFGQSSSSASSSSSCSAVSATGLLGYWKFDENSGTTAIDSAGVDNNGTLENGPAYVAGAPAVSPNVSALSFDGSDDQVRAANSGDFNFGTSPFTVSTFLKTNVGDRSVLGNFSNSVRGWGLYVYASNRVNFFGYGTLGTNDTSFSAPTILDNQWHHVAGVFTRSGNNLTIDTYVDGVLAGSNTTNVGDITSGSDLLFGKYLLQPNFQGSLDDIRVYNRALSAGEVAGLSAGCGNASSSSSVISSSSSVSSSSSISSISSSSSSSSVSSVSSVSSSSSSAGNLTCNGKQATIYVQNGKIVGGRDNGKNYYGSLVGTDGNDVIIGTPGMDNIRGRDGHDTICGRGNDDILRGSDGHDWIDGEGGDDIAYGNDGNDVILGDGGDDDLRGNDGNDVVCGQGANDTVRGNDGNDKLDGGAGNDTNRGDDGNDQCRNGEANFKCEVTNASAFAECQ